MGWFDEQIRERKKSDERVFEEALIELSDSVTGKRESASFAGGTELSKEAINEILKYYRIKNREIPDSIKDFNGQLEYVLRPNGIMCRKVNLEKGWYRDAVGPYLLTRKSDGTAVAVIPNGFGGYSYTDLSSGKKTRITSKNEGDFDSLAAAFYKPFPLRKMNTADLVKYVVSLMSAADFVFLGITAFAVTLLGMAAPKIQNFIFSSVIDSGSIQLLAASGIFLISISISQMIIGAAKELFLARINTKMSVYVQAATMMRVMSLHPRFFKKFSSGELSNRTQYMGRLCEILISSVFSTGLTSLFSIVYIAQIFVYAPLLVLPSLAIIAVTTVFSVVSSLAQMKVSKKSINRAAKESGLSYALISGIQKIKLSGAEKRAFAKWASLHAEQARLNYNPPAFLKYNSVFSMLISSVGMIIIYCVAVQSGISVADYYAFNTAYGMVSGAFASVSAVALTAANIKPILDMVKPILDSVPEISEGKRVVTQLSGSIEINNVSFRYNDNMPDVLDNLSLKIYSGQYVAVVGPTGCGKSTLMRLLLGFETPRRGAVYFDGRDISTLDMKSLRQKIGVVMQNGKLFTGDIFSNIAISAPHLSVNEAWEAAELAGIADDIRAMPMGMHTVISEGSGGISGGQRQRLMIARAIAPKPKIIMLDEATSALDNITQKKVSQSLDSLKCTRIVIAHRLSTIKQCDRIIFLEKGKIVEDGTYNELIALNGKFAELVERQRLDK